MKNIAFDIDGVLADIEKFQLKYGIEFFRDKYDKEVVNENGYGIREVFNCDSSQEVSFWLKYNLKYSYSTEPRYGASATIKKLHEEGYKIYIISSRVMTTQDNVLGSFMRNLVIKWLSKNNIYYDDIEFCSVDNSSKDKAEACKKYKIDIIVEDKVENIEELSKDIPVLCFTTRNNKDFSSNNVKRVNNFDDVYTAIKKMENEDYDFKLLSSKQRIKLPRKELLGYYENMRKYYLDLPYDEKKAEEGRNNCAKILNTMQPIFNCIYNPINIKKDDISKYRGVIFASNHLHSFDPLMITTNGKTSFRLLAKEELKYQKIGKLFKYIDSIFVDKDDDLSKEIAKSEMIKTILRGYNVMMFPEGTRNTTDKRMLDFEYGTVSTAQITGAPIIPFALNDEYHIRGNNLLINVGEPLYVYPNESLESANTRLKYAIELLLWELMEYEYEMDTGKKKVKMS